jgi:citrate lyase subunit beta-like protein
VVSTLLEEEKNSDNTSFGKSELCVRINALDTKDMALRDLQAILPCQRLETIVIPKVESPQDIHFVSQLIDMTPSCQGRDIRIIAAIESARGMLNLPLIAATAASSSNPTTAGHQPRPYRGRLDAIVFASEDYCADLEAIRTTEAKELLYARSQIVIAAKAYGLQAIDMVHIQYKDLAGLEMECNHGKELGFTGKQAIHPLQIPTIHKVFSPSPKDVEFAVRIVQEYNMTTSKGGGACVVDGIVVDQPVFKWAVKVLKRAETAGISISKNSPTSPS